MIQVYYFPIGAQTLTAVTSENIEKRGHEGVIDSQEEIDLIKKILSSANPPSVSSLGFTDQAVRVKLIEKTPQSANVIAIVEDEGFVKLADGQGKVLAPKELAALKKLVESHCK